MMLWLDRTNRTPLGRWWWTIDRYMLLTLLLIMVFGGILVMAGSPAVAERIGLHPFYFVQRHAFFTVLGLCLLVGISMLPAVTIRRVAVLGFLLFLLLMLLVPLIGYETKGAQRWLSLLGFSLQPSEFMKPCFAVLIGWLLAKSKKAGWRYYQTPALVFFGVVTLLILQPDYGMTITLTAVFIGQLFLAGLPMMLVIGAGVTGVAGMVLAYFTVPHVAKRINIYLDPSSGDSYQIQKSLEAFNSGGLFGRGPGEGIVKTSLPDSHTDFIFAVAGEELGLFACLALVALFGFFVLRTIWQLQKQENRFVLIAGAGLLMFFGLQAVINMGVALHLLPTKGMTLPLVSYGGSSMLASCLELGMLIGLLREPYDRPSRPSKRK